jgi:CCR4-NOT complex subunit CAF16
MAETNGTHVSHDIEIRSLNYKFQDGSLGLKDITLDLPAGSRTLLIGGEVPVA